MRKRQARPSTLLGTQLTVRMEFQTLNTFSSMTETVNLGVLQRSIYKELGWRVDHGPAAHTATEYVV